MRKALQDIGIGMAIGLALLVIAAGVFGVYAWLVL